MSGAIFLRGGRFEGSKLEDLRAILSGLDASKRRLVVHFHGGLVDREHGMAIAERLTPMYEQAGGYPLFVLWQSGFADTVRNRLGSIAQEKIFRRLLARTLQFTLAKAERERRDERGVELALPHLNTLISETRGDFHSEPYAQLDGEFSELSQAQEQQLLRTLRRDRVLQSETLKIVASASSERGTRTAAPVEEMATLMSSDVLGEMAGDDSRDGDRSIIATTRVAKGALMAVKRSLSRLRSGRGHGIYCTAVEELLREFYIANIGRSLWQQMKRDTEDSFGDDKHCFGGTALLSELTSLNSAMTPVLVGHSTGALYICKLLAHAEEVIPSDCAFDVAMLAPACDFDAMDRTLLGHGKRIRRLRIFSMSDEHESKDRLVSGIYPRSLLYFVSGALEKEPDWPILGMQRFHALRPPFSSDAFPAIARVRNGLSDHADSLVWSISTDGPGRCSQAIHHGDFDDDPETLASVAHMIGAR